MKKQQKQSQNFMKNELMWEEPKKKTKLYKNWKLYAIALPVIAIGAGTGSGVYYGVNGQRAKEVDLSTLNLNTQAINGNEGRDKVAAFQAFLRHNENISNLETKVAVDDDFAPPSYTQNGRLTIKAKAKSGYKGKVTVIIDTFGQVSLADLNNHLVGIENMTEDEAFAAFLAKNQDKNLDDLRANVTLDFTKPSYTTKGSLTITAKPDTKYAGWIKIDIEEVGQESLEDLDLNLNLTGIYTGQNDAFQAFLTLNPQVLDPEKNVEITNYEAADYGRSGKLVISAIDEGKYTGRVDVIISELVLLDLNNLELDQTIQGSENMTEDEAFAAFLAKNQDKNLDDLRANVTLEFTTKPDYQNDGKLTITAKPKTKYVGTITLDILKMVKVSLESLDLEQTLSDPYINKDEAFAAFLRANSTVSDLRENVTITDFKPSSWGTSGSFSIKATPEGKYDGNIPVVTGLMAQKDLSDLNQTSLIGIEGMSEVQALEAFFKNNPDASDLKQYVKVTFKAPGYDDEGSLTIAAELNTKYKGEIAIKINKISKKALEELDLILTLNQIVDNQDDAFAAFISANSGVASDLGEYTGVGGFEPPSFDKDGKLTVKAKDKGKYSGEVDVNFAPLAKTNLKELSLIDVIDGTVEMGNDKSGDVALRAFLNVNKDFDLVGNVKFSEYTAPTTKSGGHFTIEGINKYTGSIPVTLKQIVPTDQEIIDTIVDSGITFGATKSLDQTLADFIDGVLRGEEHDDPHWYIKGQIEPHKADFPILNSINYDKYEFVGFYLPDEITPLTDAYLDQNAQVEVDMQLRAKFNYGTVHDKFIDFSMGFKTSKNQ